jgi:hypothetical protein
MRIENLRSEKIEARSRVVAKVVWEDNDRPTEEVYFEIDEAFADSLTCNPNAFLVACAIPAMYYGEERIFIDSEICPELRNGLMTAMSWLRHWYYPADHKLIKIEAKTTSGIPMPRTSERAALFFSGGIDSFAALRLNRRTFPQSHPWYIRDALIVYGLELDSPEIFEYVLSSLSEAARAINITLIPIYTNLYLNYRKDDAAKDWDLWEYQFGGAALAAVAHAFSRRYTVATTAATYSLSNLNRWGSHPLLDPNYSSTDLRIRHDILSLSRLERTKLVADWDEVLPYLRVCNITHLYKPGRLNCGQCEKCIRTMLAFLILGSLDRASSLPPQEISAELILKRVRFTDDFQVSCYPEMLEPLAQMGREDLVRAIEYRLAAYDHPERGLRKRIKRIDSTHFGGKLKQAYRAIKQ